MVKVQNGAGLTSSGVTVHEDQPHSIFLYFQLTRDEFLYHLITDLSLKIRNKKNMIAH